MQRRGHRHDEPRKPGIMLTLKSGVHFPGPPGQRRGLLRRERLVIRPSLGRTWRNLSEGAAEGLRRDASTRQRDRGEGAESVWTQGDNEGECIRGDREERVMPWSVPLMCRRRGRR